MKSVELSLLLMAPHFRDHQVRVWKFSNQSDRNAAHLMLSKTSEMKENELLEVVEELSDTFHGKEYCKKIGAISAMRSYYRFLSVTVPSKERS